MSSGGYETREFPEKSWSVSRMKVINSCLREYYYQYYGSHNGWIYTSSEEAKIAWRLKKLTNIWMLFGSKMHGAFKQAIGQASQGRKPMEKELLIKIIRNGLNFVVKESGVKFSTGEWDEYPKGEMLQEYYYGETLSKAVIEDIKERLEVCATNFYTSKTFNDVLNKRLEVKENDENTFNSFYIDEMKVYSIIDTLYVDEDGNYIIVDWKTGNYNEEDKEQLLVYALYVMDRYGVSLDKIIGRVEYLLSGENDEYRFTDENVSYIKDRVSLDTNVLNAFLKDIYTNEPREKENFLKCENKNKCKICKFKRLCAQDEEELSYEAN